MFADKKKYIVAAIGLITGFIVISVALHFYNEPVMPPVQTTEQVEAINAKISEGCIDALLRSWNIIQACRDNRTNNYFVQIPPHPHNDKRYDEGWWMVDTYDFIQLQNGTYVLKSAGVWTNVELDTTGLLCKQQAFNPNWYK